MSDTSNRAITLAAEPTRPPAWMVLEAALNQRRSVRIRYRGTERLICPHALGWKHGRAKVLVYQAGGTTTTGALPTDAHQRWRSLFVDEIEDPTITDDQWQSADNYTQYSSGIDTLALAVD